MYTMPKHKVDIKLIQDNRQIIIIAYINYMQCVNTTYVTFKTCKLSSTGA